MNEDLTEDLEKIDFTSNDCVTAYFPHNSFTWHISSFNFSVLFLYIYNLFYTIISWVISLLFLRISILVFSYNTTKNKLIHNPNQTKLKS